VVVVAAAVDAGPVMCRTKKARGRGLEGSAAVVVDARNFSSAESGTGRLLWWKVREGEAE